jgi:uncharacterized membrane protein YccC
MGWQAVRMVGACALAALAAYVLGLKEGYWALISAAVVMQPALGQTVAAGRNRILGTLVGAAAGLAVIEAGRLGAPIHIMFWVALVPLALLTAAVPYMRLTIITLIVVVLLPSDGLSFSPAIGRVVEILVGSVAAIAVSAIRPRWQPDDG